MRQWDVSDDRRGEPRALQPKVIIAGTGRAGTTLLVQLLSELGADTGFTGTEAGRYSPRARAGFEGDPTAPNAPRIVKSPGLSIHLGSMIDSGAVVVEHVIVPMRDLDIAAASRIRVSGYGRDRGIPGGVWGTRDARRQREYLAGAFYELIWTCVRHDIALTLLEFPRFAAEPDYAYEKVGWVVPQASASDFAAAAAKIVDLSMISEQPLSDSERRRLIFNEPRWWLWDGPRRVLRRKLRAIAAGDRNPPKANDVGS
jgi:hypothetical protein